jgi:2'-5' RNA ligase/GNAT superfamily N-acetyltransferase
MNEALQRIPVKGHRLFFEPELDNGNITIITRSGNTVGSIWWAPRSKSSVEIETLWVSDSYQNRGLGEALLREFLKSLPSLYPQAKYITGNATSQGIIRLLTRVLGEPLNDPDAGILPKYSPNDWKETRNTEEVIFHVPTPMNKMLEVGDQMSRWDLLMEGGEFSCLMAPAPPEIKSAIMRWGQMFIDDSEVYRDPKDPDGFGREDDVHVTVKFGLHEFEPSAELLRIIQETQPFEIEIGPATLFENEDFDVVKFDVDSDALRELNRRVSELENSDSYPDYHPHMTVAYVVKGACHELIGKPLLDPEFENETRFVVKALTFSNKNKEKVTLFLGKPNLVSENLEDEDVRDLEDVKDIYVQDFKRFTDADVEASGTDFPFIRAEPEDLVKEPARKLQKQHDSGFGPQVGSGLKICFNGRLYRLHVWDHGDHSSVSFKANRKRIFLH